MEENTVDKGPEELKIKPEDFAAKEEVAKDNSSKLVLFLLVCFGGCLGLIAIVFLYIKSRGVF